MFLILYLHQYPKCFPHPKSHMQGVLQCGEDGGGSGGHSPVIVEW